MELQFNQSVCPYLRTLTSQVQNQEQTQEVRLPDGMPDIGRVLGSWGQALIRGKEWRSDGMTVSGGVLAWTLYAPEDGSEPRCVDTWIPFQFKWDFPEAKRDGTICAAVTLKSMDARCVSARKLMVRAGISAWGEALEPAETEIFAASQLPEDVQLLQNSYPMEVPLEAGEKLCQLQEELAPEGGKQVHKIIRYCAEAQILEHRVMTGRLIFRGNVSVEMLCADDTGALFRQQWQIPFSQFVDLDRDYGTSAVAWLLPVVTGLEIERNDQGALQLKCAVAVQYVIYDRMVLQVVEDAYSPMRSVELQTRELVLPARLDAKRETAAVEHTVQSGDGTFLDGQWTGEYPQAQQNGDLVKIRLPGQFQMLSRDSSGLIQGVTSKEEAGWEIPSDRGNRLRVTVQPSGWTEAVTTGDGWKLKQELAVDTEVFSEQGISMVTGLVLGEEGEPDPGRPSLILQRKGSQSLWQIAKRCGSTVDRICQANGIDTDPEEDRLLLIPVV